MDAIEILKYINKKIRNRITYNSLLEKIITDLLVSKSDKQIIKIIFCVVNERKQKELIQILQDEKSVKYYLELETSGKNDMIYLEGWKDDLHNGWFSKWEVEQMRLWTADPDDPIDHINHCTKPTHTTEGIIKRIERELEVIVEKYEGVNEGEKKLLLEKQKKLTEKLGIKKRTLDYGKGLREKSIEKIIKELK